MPISFELVTVDIKGQTYHGLFHRSGTPKGTVLHVHGTWGNFYENPFIAPLGEFYGGHRFSYLTANFPGHDSTSVDENFDVATAAIDAWLQDFSADSVILQGHSLGALKILRYMQDSRAKNVACIRGLVLLAPFDIVAFYGGRGPHQIEQTRATMARLLSETGSASLTPSEVFSMWPISIGTLSSLIVDDGPADRFPTRKSTSLLPLGRLGLPMFVAIGSEDIASYPSPGDAIEIAKSIPHAAAVLIDGAPHNFAGRVKQLIDAVSNWWPF